MVRDYRGTVLAVLAAIALPFVLCALAAFGVTGDLEAMREAAQILVAVIAALALGVAIEGAWK